jgi:hypothetical protein
MAKHANRCASKSGAPFERGEGLMVAGDRRRKKPIRGVAANSAGGYSIKNFSEIHNGRRHPHSAVPDLNRHDFFFFAQVIVKFDPDKILIDVQELVFIDVDGTLKI